MMTMTIFGIIGGLIMAATKRFKVSRGEIPLSLGLTSSTCSSLG